MSEPTTPSEAGSVSVSKSAVGEINENTLNNVAIPEINKVLVEGINPDFGILDKLLASKALSRPEVEEVKRLSTSHDKNSRLLELVTKKEKLTELLNALKDTHQEHLVNYVTAKGVYSQDYGGTWPLTEQETSIIDVNQGSLVDVLDFTGDEIINMLYMANVLNRRQKEFLCKQSYDYEKAEALLGFLYRSSLSDYWKMINCLGATKQQPAAKILLEGGALVRVHNAVNAEKEAATAAEIEIVARIESILSSMNIEESNRILERLHLRVFAARVGNSVNLYILCETTDELMHLSNLLTSGELQRGIEVLFNKLVTRSERVNVFTTVSEETLAKCKKFLEVDLSQKDVSSKDILKLCEQMKVEEERRTEEKEEEAMNAGESHPGVEEMQEEAAVYADYEEAEKEKGGGPNRKPAPMTVVKTSSLCHEKDLPVPKGSACALATLDSNIYILCQKPSSIIVFDKLDSSEHRGEIPVTVITDPVDIVASQQSACLYITDRGNSSVWKLTPTDNNVIPWLQNIGSPYTLSATSTGGVIRVDQGHPSHLEIYSADAQRINRIALPAIVKVPYHAVETSAGTYVISYGESSGNNGVCEITRDGNVVSVFDTLLKAVEGIDLNVNKILKEMFAEKLVCCPRYLAVNERGEIYATDSVNGGVMVFDSRLKLEAVIGKDLVKKPVNVLCLKNMRKLLIVYCKEEQQTGIVLLEADLKVLL